MAKDQQRQDHVPGLDANTWFTSLVPKIYPEYAFRSYHEVAGGLLWHVTQTMVYRAGSRKMGNCAADNIDWTSGILP